MSGAGEEIPQEPIYGGFDGPGAMYLKLISSDNHEFIIKRQDAYVSGLIRAMLSDVPPCAEGRANILLFRQIPSHVLQAMCRYLAFRARNPESREFPTGIPLTWELYMAAHYLQC